MHLARIKRVEQGPCLVAFEAIRRPGSTEIAFGVSDTVDELANDADANTDSVEETLSFDDIVNASWKVIDVTV